MNPIKLPNTNEIIRAEADGSYTRLYLTNGKMIEHTKILKALEELFNNKNHFFFRTHKKHLINLHYVQSVTRKGDYVLMTDGAKIPIAKKNRHFFTPKIFLELSTH